MKLKTLLFVLTIASTGSLLGMTTASAQEKISTISAQVSIVNINTADAEALASLPGIGPKKAESIVSYRKINGKFQTVNELANVKGIGKKMVEKLSDQVSI